MKTQNKAFTLVELIIVIAVIGVLAAILIPVFSNVIDKANAKSALSDARNSIEQVIIDATENQSMPENILIIVRKASSFYVYGFNRTSDNTLYQSPGNPFRNFSDVQSLIDARSWNGLQGDAVPDPATAYTDYDTYGYFYLVPYAGGVSQAPAIKGVKAASEYLEISNHANALMTENMGDDVHIYHGILTDRASTDEQTQGSSNATPLPSITPSPTPDSTTPPRQYHVNFTFLNYNGSAYFDGSDADKYTFKYSFDLVPGTNRFTVQELIDSGRWVHYNENGEYYYAPVVRGTHTILDYVEIELVDANMSGTDSIEVTVYTDLVPKSPSDATTEKQSYTVAFYFLDYDGSTLFNDEAHSYTYTFDLSLGANIFTVEELMAASRWLQYTESDDYYYAPVIPYTHTVCDSISIGLYSVNTTDVIRVNIYTDLVPSK